MNEVEFTRAILNGDEIGKSVIPVIDIAGLNFGTNSGNLKFSIPVTINITSQDGYTVYINDGSFVNVDGADAPSRKSFNSVVSVTEYQSAM